MFILAKYPHFTHAKCDFSIKKKIKKIKIKKSKNLKKLKKIQKNQKFYL